MATGIACRCAPAPTAPTPAALAARAAPSPAPASGNLPPEATPSAEEPPSARPRRTTHAAAPAPRPRPPPAAAAAAAASPRRAPPAAPAPPAPPAPAAPGSGPGPGPGPPRGPPIAGLVQCRRPGLARAPAPGAERGGGAGQGVMGGAGGPRGGEGLGALRLYATRQRAYVAGREPGGGAWRVLKVGRGPGPLEAQEDPGSYSSGELESLLRCVDAGNAPHRGLRLLAEGAVLLGAVRFCHGPYLVLATQRQRVGRVGGHDIFRALGVRMEPLFGPWELPGGREHPSEARYVRLFEAMAGNDEFFYSPTYQLHLSLQVNQDGGGEQEGPFGHRFIWNSFLAANLGVGLPAGVLQRWVTPVIHGFFHQVDLSIFGRRLSLALVARRSRHFAGTRFLKRGVNALGQVANEVETEQIVDASRGAAPSTAEQMSSMVQLRGSIPLVWCQESNPLNPKPDILIQRYDPMLSLTRAHFEDLRRRYGPPCVVLNLIKSLERKPREMLLREEYARALDSLNRRTPPPERILFAHWDFSKNCGGRGADVLSALGPVAKACLERTGLFCAPRRTSKGGSCRGSRQSGVVRTNCIDCLDRTNVAQFVVGLKALGMQLQMLGITGHDDVRAHSSVGLQLMAQYEAMGDALAQQYGGSEAHAKFFQRFKGSWEYALQSKEMLTSFRRFYNNSYTDSLKQDCINLFLGHFQPGPNMPELWELENDHYLPSLYQEHPCSLGPLRPQCTPPGRDPGSPVEPPRAAPWVPGGIFAASAAPPPQPLQRAWSMYSEARDTLSRYLRGSEDQSVAGEVWNAPGSADIRDEGGVQSFDEIFREGPVTLHGMKLGFSSPGREAGPTADPGDSPLDDASSAASGTLGSADRDPGAQVADDLNLRQATGQSQGKLWRMLATSSRKLRLSGFRSQTSRLGAAGTPSLVRRGRALAEEFGREAISEGEEASEGEDWTRPSYKAYASCDLGSIGAGGGSGCAAGGANRARAFVGSGLPIVPPWLTGLPEAYGLAASRVIPVRRVPGAARGPLPGRPPVRRRALRGAGLLLPRPPPPVVV